jgi:hypothetical protein
LYSQAWFPSVALSIIGYHNDNRIPFQANRRRQCGIFVDQF